MNIPCKDCLKLPICINKTEILCQDMVDYMNVISQLRITFWDEVSEVLPNLEYVHDYPREYRMDQGYRGFHK